MTKLTDKINWDEFDEAEQQAIAIHFDNMTNGTDNPTFPYSAAVFEELAENLASVALLKPNSALRMVSELQAINKVLLGIIPIPPTKDEKELAQLFTDKEIKQNLLSCNVGFFLVGQFSHIINYIIMAQEMAVGGDNGTKH